MHFAIRWGFVALAAWLLGGCAGMGDDDYIVVDGQVIQRHPLKQGYPRREPVEQPRRAFAQPEVKKVLLPYIEGEGIFERRKIFWITDNDVAYTVVKPHTLHLSAEDSKRLINPDDNPDYFVSRRDQYHEVHILDTRTGRTRKHADGTLVDYKAGVVRIVLEHYSKRHPNPSMTTGQEYSVMLVGPLGKEERISGTPNQKSRSQRECTGVPQQVPDSYLRYLMPEHGCLRIPYKTKPPIDKTIFYKTDGSNMELPLSREDVPGEPQWIEWLGAYQLRSVAKSNIEIQAMQARGEIIMDTINFLKPDGRLLLEPLEILPSYTETNMPTRAGMIKYYYKQLTPTDDGVHLHRNGEIFQLSEGNIDRTLSVSPNGCKVAFPSAKRSWITLNNSFKDFRVRVIDVCKAFNLTTDTIPFQW